MNLSEKFIKGLEQYGLKLHDLKDWRYLGGNKGRHLNYYHLACGTENLPEFNSRCVCGHKIEENCYIGNEVNLLILGNCCIKKFIEKNGRRCCICRNPHRNIKIDKCNKCRGCYKCDNPRKPNHKYCWECYKTNTFV